MGKISGLFGVLAVALVVGSCGGGGDGGTSPPPPPPPPPPTCPEGVFCMDGSRFFPTARTVTVGSTVTWRNESSGPHNVTWDNAAGRNAAVPGDGSGDIPDYSSGDHTRRFNTTGTFGFHCTIHAGMDGTLTVQ